MEAGLYSYRNVVYVPQIEKKSWFVAYKLILIFMKRIGEQSLIRFFYFLSQNSFSFFSGINSVHFFH